MLSISSYFKSRKPYYYLALVTGAVTFFLFNVFTPMKCDDLMFRLSFVDGESGIASAGDFFTSVGSMYDTLNGRLSNVLTHLFCAVTGKGVFNVLNTIVFMLLIVLTDRFVRHARSVAVVLLTAVFLLYFLPAPGQTLLWLTGAVAALWSVTLALLTIYIALRRSEWLNGGLWRVVAVCVLAFVAGNMHEGVSIPAALAFVAYTVLNFRRVNSRQLAVVVAFVAGVIVLLVAPGSLAEVPNPALAGMDVTDRVRLNLKQTVFAMWELKLPLIALLVGGYNLLRNGIAPMIRSILTWLFVGAIAALLLRGCVTDLSMMMLALSSYLIVARALISVLITHHNAMRIGEALMAAVATLGLSQAASVILLFHEYNNHVAEVIAKAPDDGILPAMRFEKSNRFVMAYNYDSFRSKPYTYYIRKAYGLDNLQFLPFDIYTLYKDGALLDSLQTDVFTSNYPNLVSDVQFSDEHRYVLVPVNSGNCSPLPSGVDIVTRAPRQQMPPEAFERLLGEGLLTEDAYRYTVNAALVPLDAERFAMIFRTPGIKIDEMTLNLKVDGNDVSVNLNR